VTRLYTRNGDQGTTGLLGLGRVPKDDPCVEALGAVDELNAVLGLALSAQKRKAIRKVLERIQDDLFTVGAELATPQAGPAIPRITDHHVERLEAFLDDFEVGPLKEFLLPRGSEGLTRLHWARTVARRAERRVVTLSHREAINPKLLRYMNRLSSLLYEMAVWLQEQEKRKREHPTYRA
jgi:cob(I)alamin adenosyltransferase